MIYLTLFFTFLKVGAFTFGGGYAMLPLIQEEIERHGWLSAEQLVNFIAVSESTPGPFAVNISTYVGIETGGIFGAVCATTGVILPSFVIILIIARAYEKFGKSRIVSGCMDGLKPAVVGLIGAAVISVGQTVFFEGGFSFGRFSDTEFLCMAGTFILMLVLAFRKLHPIIIIVLSAVIGVLYGVLTG